MAPRETREATRLETPREPPALSPTRSTLFECIVPSLERLHAANVGRQKREARFWPQQAATSEHGYQGRYPACGWRGAERESHNSVRRERGVARHTPCRTSAAHLHL